jgi:transglutaminase-like putative cysteine protease
MSAAIALREKPASRSGPRRTLLALLASCLGAVPLKALLSDSGWLFEAWLTMALAVAPAALLRLRRAPSALDVWPGIILLVPWLTRLFVSAHAWGGFIPSGRTFRDVGHLMTNLHDTTSNEVAPIHSTVAVRLVLCALLGLLAALIDLIAVVGRRGALAGVPLLIVYTVSGAVPRSPVAWFWFAIAACGFLILLALDADDELREWGRRIPRRGGAMSRPAVAISAQRIGIFAVLVAVILPFAVPANSRNWLSDAFHSSGKGGIGGFGAGSGGGGISPFAALKGQLNRGKAVSLLRVHINPLSGPVQPFYVRSNVLDKFTGDGWAVSEHGATEQLNATTFDTRPSTREASTATYEAQIEILGLTGNAPIFNKPDSVTGLTGDVTWSPQDQLLIGGSVQSGQHFIERVDQPAPTLAELVGGVGGGPQSGGSPDTAGLTRWLQLPQLPRYVTDLVARLTAGKSTEFAKARAIFDFFADPANGFVYSLKTTKGDSGNDLVDFLQNRAGFCQQFAAAMGVMLRAAGVPSRIVLGYEHAPPDKSGNFTISTLDAHAWVEGLLPDVGWIPFDPTPPDGLIGGKTTDLAWAPHPYGSQGVDVPTRTSSNQPIQRSSVAPSASNGPQLGVSHGASSLGPLWWTLGVLLVLALVTFLPALVRAGRRRSRFAAARRGDPDPLWAELSDTAIDLGYVWSPARTPRQVSDWLATDAADTAPALQALAVAVERRRYAPTGSAIDAGELADGLREVTDQLRARRRGRVRLGARLWPASLGWGRKVAAVSGVLRRRH